MTQEFLVLRPLLASLSLVAGAAHAGEPPPTTTTTTTTTTTAAAPPTAATSTGHEGLPAGTAAPTFLLPIVNDFTPPVVGTGLLAAKRATWGPAKWTGEKPDEAKKLVVMSFFATYCEPCKKEMPELARLYDAYKDQGLGVMLVSIDKPDEVDEGGKKHDRKRDEIVALAQQNNVHFPVVHDRFQIVARKYGAERLPYMLMLDTAGAVKVVHVGYTDDVKANLDSEVRQQLGLPPLPPPPAVKTDKADKGGKNGEGSKKASSSTKPKG
jgi:thiol-disulfide isomerase/thioredoxin